MSSLPTTPRRASTGVPILRHSVTVRVPATSANLGPGYDCLGVAVDLWNEVTVEHAECFSMMIEGEGADKIPRNSDNFVVLGVEMVFKKFGMQMPTLAYFCKNGIPFGSGLGSSSAAIVSGLLAGLVLAGKELPVVGQETLLQMAAEVEGHIDNLSPCIYGGMQLGMKIGNRWSTTMINMPQAMQLVVFTPSTTMATAEARAMLPDMIPRDDAVFNMSRLALLINSIATNSWDALRVATQDRLHQPIRGSDDVMPWLFPVIDAALEAGAKGAFLSGAGSSIMAIAQKSRGDRLAQSRAERTDSAIAMAMSKAAEKINVDGRIFVTKMSMVGAHVVEFTDHKPLAGMRYHSTRDVAGAKLSFKDVVMKGLAGDGGLFVPETIPTVTSGTIKSWRGMGYTDLAAQVMSRFIGTEDISQTKLAKIIERSYATFSSKHVVPLVRIDENICIMEQFRGPTCAFKDVALQFLGNLFSHFLESDNASRPKGSKEKRINVLGATSGDTGGAAIEGLRGKKNIDIFILFPKGRVAPVQEAQMTTVPDTNVHCVSLEGTFDDCQDTVKELFNDEAFNTEMGLAAVNSVNFARILAQIVYYFYGYFRWLDLDDTRQFGDTLDFVVPSGNFGNALAGFYAKSMGLPIGKLCVSTNSNDILHRFFSEGDYTARTCVPTLAPAMDITKSSNFERYLFHLLGDDAAALGACMESIRTTGGFDLGERTKELMARVHAEFQSTRSSDDDIARVTEEYKEKHGYFLCPHTACGIDGIQKAFLAKGDSFVCLATAHPGKFDNYVDGDKYEPALPPQLKGLTSRKARVTRIKKDSAKVKQILRERQQVPEEPAAVPAEPEAGPGTMLVPMLVAWGVGVLSAVAVLNVLKSRS